MTAEQTALIKKQSEFIDYQREQQDAERARLMRERSDTAAEEAMTRSTARRSGVMAESVGRAGYGGYDKPMPGGGVARSYEPPPLPVEEEPAGGGGSQPDSEYDPLVRAANAAGGFKGLLYGEAIKGGTGLTAGQSAAQWIAKNDPKFERTLKEIRIKDGLTDGQAASEYLREKYGKDYEMRLFEESLKDGLTPGQMAAEYLKEKQQDAYNDRVADIRDRKAAGTYDPVEHFNQLGAERRAAKKADKKDISDYYSYFL